MVVGDEWAAGAPCQQADRHTALATRRCTASPSRGRGERSQRLGANEHTISIAPPEIAPPEIVPPEIAPPEIAPPEIAPPEIAPPEIAARR